MREALQNLQIPFAENLDFVIARAWSVRGLRGKESVSRSSILYAAATIQPLVLALLETNRLNVAAWERSLGFASKPVFDEDNEQPEMNFPVGSDTSAVFEEYRSRWPNRPLDALGLATVILKSASESRHLAGLNVSEAIERAEAFTNASPDGEFIDPATLNFLFSDRTDAIFRRASGEAMQRSLSFPALTTSELFIAAIMLNDTDDPTAPRFLRTFVQSASHGETPTGKFNEWMTWYGNEGPRSFTQWTQPLTAVVERARLLAHDINSKKGAITAISARHFVGALIASQRWAANSGISDLLKKLDIGPKILTRGYFAYLESAPAPSGRDDLGVWRRFLGLSEQSYVPRFDAESLDGADLLQISADVDAFASLLASNRIAPPLSIGLFGDWGSGKSFFMARMRAEIAERAQRAAIGDAVFLQRIVQIDFNAWHYVEANLWASLVEHLFRNLKLTYEKPTDTKIAERRDELLQKLDGLMAKRIEAEKKVQQAEIERDRMAQNLDARRQAAEASAAVVQGMRAKDVWSLVAVGDETRQQLQAELAKVGVNAALKSNEELRKTVDDLRGVGTRVKLLVSWVVQQPRMLVMLLTLVVLVPVGVGAALKLMQSFQLSIAAVLAAFVSYAGFFTRFTTKHLTTGKAILDRIDTARKTIDKKLQEAETDRQKTIDDAGSALAAATQQVSAAKTAVENRENDVAAAKKALLELTNGYRLTRFIDERAASDDYRKLLGVLATVRNDFSTLSELMHPAEGKSDVSDKLRIDRIILYIDDLDRCSPDRVVDVLQAVHLLLAFKLFVVVVGVDARWVTESLRQKHKTLRSRNDDDEETSDGDDLPGYHVEPHHYLEKIFQVPFWLEPLQETTTASYVRSLLAGDVRPPRNTFIADAALVSGGGDGSSGGATTRPRAARNTMAADEGTDTDPKQLTIDTRERDYMSSDAIARLIGRSPRTAKRFVNTYRFFRARMANEKLSEYLAEAAPPQYRCALLLLAIVVGAPDVSLEVFAQIKESAAASVADFAASMKTKEEHAAQWASVKAALAEFEKGKAPLADFITHLPRIIRYSFRAPYAPSVARKERAPRKVYMVPIREEAPGPSPVV
jgi:transposase